MKKKNILLLLLIISIIFTIITIIIIRNIKGYETFGSEYCSGHDNGHESYKVGASVIVDWTCKICGYKRTYGNSANVPTICSVCAKVTGRCSECGKLLKK